MTFFKHAFSKALFVGAISLTGITSCTKDQIQRMTYETLRQQDCYLNSPQTIYCDRSYSFEYDEYQYQRRNYFRQINASQNRKTYIEAENSAGSVLIRVSSD